MDAKSTRLSRDAQDSTLFRPCCIPGVDGDPGWNPCSPACEFKFHGTRSQFPEVDLSESVALVRTRGGRRRPAGLSSRSCQIVVGISSSSGVEQLCCIQRREGQLSSRSRIRRHIEEGAAAALSRSLTGSFFACGWGPKANWLRETWNDSFDILSYSPSHTRASETKTAGTQVRAAYPPVAARLEVLICNSASASAFEDELGRSRQRQQQWRAATSCDPT